MPKNIFDKSNFKDCDTGATTEAPFTPDDRIKSGKPISRMVGGLMHTPTPKPGMIYDAADDEKVISNANAYIVFGSDRPSTKAGGMGAQGAPSDTIDLVVGRMASSFAGKGPCDGMVVNNNFAADAARIYISRLTNLDTNFGIASGKLRNEAPRSGIGIKADHVRIIGREGVKIISGGMQGVKGYGFKGETNSLGGKLESSPRIDLIAGNNTSSRRVWGGIFKPRDRVEHLQPLVKGDNAVRCLEELAEIVADMLASLLNLSIATSVAFTGMGAAHPPLAAVAAPATAMIGNFVTSTVYQTRIKKIIWEFNYLNSNAQRYICSQNVSTT